MYYPPPCHPSTSPSMHLSLIPSLLSYSLSSLLLSPSTSLIALSHKRDYHWRPSSCGFSSLRNSFLWNNIKCRVAMNGMPLLFSFPVIIQVTELCSIWEAASGLVKVSCASYLVIDLHELNEQASCTQHRHCPCAEGSTVAVPSRRVTQRPAATLCR